MLLTLAVTGAGLVFAAPPQPFDVDVTSLISKGFPPHVVLPKGTSDRDAVIKALRQQARQANAKQLQAIEFVLAELGADYPANRAFLLNLLHSCGTPGAACDEDTAAYVIGLYADGHHDVLHALFSVGLHSDAALSGMLASFYGDVLKSSPGEFVETLGSFKSENQKQLCHMTGTGDGGGVSADVLTSARAHLEMTKNRIATSCLHEIEAADMVARKAN